MKKSIIRGTFLLTLSGLIVRFIGFFNRIYLANCIGTYELGKYQLIFPVYILLYSFTCQGVSTALSKSVSYYENSLRVKNTLFYNCFIITVILSFLSSLLLFTFSNQISTVFLHNSECGILLKIISPAVFIVAVKGILNGFFLGVHKPDYLAISQIIEQLARVSFTVVIISFTSENEHNSIIAAATLTLGELISMLCSAFFFLKDSVSREVIINCLFNMKMMKTSLPHIFIKDSFSLTVNRTAVTLLSSIEAVILPLKLALYYHDESYGLIIYGVITGLVMPFVLVPATITNALSQNLLPEVSKLFGRKDKDRIMLLFYRIFIFCGALGIVSWIMLFLGSRIIGIYILHEDLSIMILKELSVICPLMYVSQTLSTFINGLDLTVLNLILNVSSTLIRIFIIIKAVPVYGTAGYTISLIISYLILTVAFVLTIVRKTKPIHHNESLHQSINHMELSDKHNS